MAWIEAHATGIKRHGPSSLPLASNKIKTPHAYLAAQSFLAIHPFVWASTLMTSYILVQVSWLKQNFSDALKKIRTCYLTLKVNPKLFGMKWQQIADDESLTIHLSQESTISTLVEELVLEDVNSVQTPYRSGCPVDKIPSADHLPPSWLQSAQ